MPGWSKLSPPAYRHLTPIFMLENFSFRADGRPKCIDTSCQYAWLKAVNKMCTAAILCDLVQCLMCNVCQITPKSVELVRMTMEVTWKCHFQMLTQLITHWIKNFKTVRYFLHPCTISFLRTYIKMAKRSTHECIFIIQIDTVLFVWQQILW